MEVRVGFLDRFEQRLEGTVQNGFARMFRSAVQPVEIAAALIREVDNSAQILSRARRLAPNDFVVELSDSDHDRIDPISGQLRVELIEQLQEHATKQGYTFTGPVSIAFVHGDGLTTGRFRVRSQSLSPVSQHGAPVRSTDTQIRSASAYLEINGERVTLSPPGVVVGRGTDADLRIDDPGVSRRHFEIRLVQTNGGTRASVHDLGSTNGILVNGRRTDEAGLADGSMIRAGNTTLTFHLAGPSDGGY
ncbi:MAG: FhaA domain-containing protein [Marmoricola sp.]